MLDGDDIVVVPYAIPTPDIAVRMHGDSFVIPGGWELTRHDSASGIQT